MSKNEVLSFDCFVSIMAVALLTLNLLHVSSCEMVTFCDILHEQKQTLESAQYGLEISFNKNSPLLTFNLGAFHSTKYSGLKFWVFHATNGTVFSGSLDSTRLSSMVIRFQVWRENTKSKGGLFYLCLLAFRLLDRRR